jgi:hypothetical protein
MAAANVPVVVITAVSVCLNLLGNFGEMILNRSLGIWKNLRAIV